MFHFVFAQPSSVNNNCEDAELIALRKMLAEMSHDDEKGRKLIEEKIEMYEKMAAICSTITPAIVDPNKTPQFVPESPIPFVTGIFDGQPGAYFHAFEAIIENHWKGIVDGEKILVLAGVWVKDPNQGFIVVINRNPSKDRSYFPSPTKSGALRILEARGLRLIIHQANDSKLLFFDIPALTYVSSLDAVVVPLTPTTIPATSQPGSSLYPQP